MSTLKVVNIQHPSAASATLILDSSGNLALPAGSASTPALQGPSDTNTGLFFPAADTIAFAEGGTEALRIDSSGRVGIGTSSPSYILEVRQDSSGVPVGINMVDTNASGRSYSIRSDAGQLRFRDVTGSADRVTLDSSGRLGIGTTSPQADLHIGNADGASRSIVIHTINNGDARLRFREGSTVGSGYNEYSFGMAGNANAMTWESQGLGEIGRWDSSGRLLVGTSSARDNFFNTSGFGGLLQVEGANSNATRTSSFTYGIADTAGPIITLAKHRSNSVGGNTVVASGDQLGGITFQGSDGSEFVIGAQISAEVDATPGANDMPGRLVFSTTADGASSPTERMRISANGSVDINAGDISTNPRVLIRTGSNTPLSVDRFTDDGNVIDIRQANTIEGAISVSGTTVTYGGGHLARWSQLPNDEDPSTLLKGTVLSNLDEMCGWGEEDNEQLNKTKVSDVEGDKNVAGVFVSVSPSEDGPLDFFCAMTGDMIIRIAAGVTVERGDLLMSAGDGTAKPQDDDIIRSKTIAKVTSTHVSCTYEDGSYCVPCVLMAC